MRIEPEELKKLYEKNSNKVACEKLKVTNATLISYLKKCGIKLKGKGNRDSKSKVLLDKS